MSNRAGRGAYVCTAEGCARRFSAGDDAVEALVGRRRNAMALSHRRMVCGFARGGLAWAAIAGAVTSPCAGQCPSFAAPVSYPVGAGPSVIAVGDFNNDGKLDLVVLAGAQISVLLGMGSGTFGTPIIRTVGDGPS